MIASRSLMLACLLFALPASAGSFVVPADISVALNAEPNVGLVPGQPIVFTMSVTNHGPDPAEYIAIRTSEFTTEFDLGSASSDCQFLGLVVVDQEFSSYYLYNWIQTLAGTLEVGETRTCHLTIPLSPDAPADLSFGFFISDFFIDLDPSNNSASVTLHRAVTDATPIPALSSRALILLALLLAAIGVQAAGSTVRRTARSR